MTFHAYRGNPFEHTHENKAFNYLHDLLEAQWSERDEPLHLLGNFFVEGREVDALVLKRNAVIVIDFKDYGGNLIFSENGPWRIGDVTVKGGNSANPYQQIRNNKYTVMNYIKDRIDLKSNPNLGHIAGLCLFHQDIDFDTSTLPMTVSRWFHITDMANVVRDIDAIVSPATDLPQSDIDTILSHWNVPDFFPDGRPSVVPISPIEGNNDKLEIIWTSEQIKALTAVDEWLESSHKEVISLSGAYHTGKRSLLSEVSHRVIKRDKSLIYLAPNARIANIYKSRGFSDCQSIYSWLYASRPNEFKNGKAIYPVMLDSLPNAHTEILVFVESHLFGDDKFETDTIVYGSGFLIQDLLDALMGKKNNDNSVQEQTSLCSFPKCLLLGDPYQLTRGSRERSLLHCQAFEKKGIEYISVELQAQVRPIDAPAERLDFQRTLVQGMSGVKYIRLPICQGKHISTIDSGQYTQEIANDLLRWPKDTVYLCAKNVQVFKVNRAVRSQYLSTTNMHKLIVGDIVDFHNRTPILQENNISIEGLDWVNAGDLGHIVAVDTETVIRSTPLKGREHDVSVEFSTATIELTSGRQVTVRYLTDYLAAEKPELTQDQIIALQIWARQDAEKMLASEKEEIQKLKEHSPNDFKIKNSQYQQRLMAIILSNEFFNAARLRFAYALTVHRAQTYNPFSSVVLNAAESFDTNNCATDSYFRWLYTATICTSDTIRLLNYPLLTPLSNASWHVSGVKFSPIVLKQRFYFDQNRQPNDTELSLDVPNGFTNPAPQLLALLLSINEIILGAGWEVDTITQHNYKDRYVFVNHDSSVEIDFNYNGKFEVSFGAGTGEDLEVVKKLLITEPQYFDENIKVVVEELNHLATSKDWSIVSTDEKPQKVYVILEHVIGLLKIELNVPSKGVVSSIKVIQSDNSDVLKQFEKDFINV